MTPASHRAVVTALRQMLRRFLFAPVTLLGRVTLNQISDGVFRLQPEATLPGLADWSLVVVDDRVPARSPTRQPWRGTVVLSRDDVSFILGHVGHFAATPFQSGPEAEPELEPYHIFSLQEADSEPTRSAVVDLIDNLYIDASDPHSDSSTERDWFFIRNRVLKRIVTDNPVVIGIPRVEQMCLEARRAVTDNRLLGGWELLPRQQIRRLFALAGSGQSFNSSHSSQFILESIGLAQPIPRNGVVGGYPDSRLLTPPEPEAAPTPIDFDLLNVEDDLAVPPPPPFPAWSGLRPRNQSPSPSPPPRPDPLPLVVVNSIPSGRFDDLRDDLHDSITKSSLARLRLGVSTIPGATLLRDLAVSGELIAHCEDGRSLRVQLLVPTALPAPADTSDSERSVVDSVRYLDLDDGPEIPFTEET